MIKNLVVSKLYNIAAVINKNQIQKLLVLDDNYQVGDIYLGVINKIFQSINAAFVDLKLNNKSGFIHAHDSGSTRRKLTGTNKIGEIFTINQAVLVQVVKEPTLHKGPKLTTNIKLYGKYLILMPFNNIICITRHISNFKERSYLKALAILFKPPKMGLLFQQNSVGISEDLLVDEINALEKQWNFIEKSVLNRIRPCLIYQNNSIIKRTLQDFYNSSIQNIFIDSIQSLLRLQKFFQNSVSYNKTHVTKLPLLKPKLNSIIPFDLSSKIIKTVKTHVSLAFGGYISIEISETLTLIDVNSGSFTNSPAPRDTIIITNCLAATEIAYQLRVQNITGIIIIDFINMYNKRDKLYILQYFSKVLQKDDIKPKIIQISELGLIEIVRQRKEKNIQELLSHRLFTETYTCFPGKLLTYNKQYHKLIITVTKTHSNSLFFKKHFIFYCFLFKKKYIHSTYNLSKTLIKYANLLEIYPMCLINYNIKISPSCLYHIFIDYWV
uniref:Ribonuclease E n=1 Tax=Apophlaea sinclairii TaxID=212746 RepID=A0A1C9CBP6_9FLOR|nr:ribonuclease E [Apophlaea sinclairii]AOM65795.1 ribonuclease E [Apophlaea sinclairii]